MVREEQELEMILECSILECKNIATVGNKCTECHDVSIRMEKLWKEKTKEIIIDEL